VPVFWKFITQASFSIWGPPKNLSVMYVEKRAQWNHKGLFVC
jgi:hypothetical protein